MSNQYPTVYSTVDIAIFNDDGDLLLGRKPHEEKFRFVGGFVDIKDDSFEIAAKREALEETHLLVDDLKYVRSMRVDDWRYEKITDRGIMTHFYKAKRTHGHAKAGDDIAEVVWKNPYDLNESNMVSEHFELLKSIRPES